MSQGGSSLKLCLWSLLKYIYNVALDDKNRNYFEFASCDEGEQYIVLSTEFNIYYKKPKYIQYIHIAELNEVYRSFQTFFVQSVKQTWPYTNECIPSLYSWWTILNMLSKLHSLSICILYRFRTIICMLSKLLFPTVPSATCSLYS